MRMDQWQYTPAPEITFPSVANEFDNSYDPALDAVLQWEPPHSISVAPVEQPSELFPQHSSSREAPFLSRPAPVPIFPVTPPDPSPASHADPSWAPPPPPPPPPPAAAPPPSSDFMRQDNTRLRNGNEQLRDEVEALRRRQDEARGRLRPLESSLQELLYLPAVQGGGAGVTGRLFAVLDEMMAVSRVLSFGGGKG